MAHGVEVEYHVSVSSRTPQQLTAPTVVEIGELTPVGPVSFADELNGEGEASLSVEPETLNQDVANRLANLRDMPCEINIYRESDIVWSGPLLSCQLQGPTLTLNARGLLYYLRYMTLEADLMYASPTDQYVIGKGLVDAYQSLDYGNYGIVTSGIGTSGVTRIRHYPYIENQNVFDRLIQLAEVDNGFDVWVVPSDRGLNFAATKGSDKTQTIFADISNIINPNAFWSIAEDNVASDGIAVGTSGDPAVAPVVGVATPNTTMRQTFGRVTIFTAAEDVTQQATIDDYAQRIVDARGDQLIVPGPSVVTVADVNPVTLETGDTFTYSQKVGRIGTIVVTRRLRMRRTNIDEEGVETMELELV